MEDLQLSRRLEAAAEALRDLRAMRREAEERVREALGESKRSHRVTGTKWQRNARKSQEPDRARDKNPEMLLGHIQEDLSQAIEASSLRRIGSGSLAPRLRLGSSGVTSDLLFSRRFSGNCLSSHSSGFYDASDLDSTSSSCSSLCSDSSFPLSYSVMSPHRSSAMRPRSIDYTAERRKELQKGRAQPRRPISAGALEGVYLSSITHSHYDTSQCNDRSTCDYCTPLLGDIQQRLKAERYICKLALKHHCKPGVSNPLPDLGPPTPKALPLAFISSDDSHPPSPRTPSLSSSMGDVRKTPRGSWGRFFSRVVLRKDSRIAASELNLQRCGRSPQHSLRSPSLAEGQLVRAKSFRDLLAVNPFKRSQKCLNKVW
ncbi:uncharacterized protein PAF06_014957 [Gastrophryne carolinensis]